MPERRCSDPRLDYNLAGTKSSSSIRALPPTDATDNGDTLGSASVPAAGFSESEKPHKRKDLRSSNGMQERTHSANGRKRAWGEYLSNQSATTNCDIATNGPSGSIGSVQIPTSKYRSGNEGISGTGDKRGQSNGRDNIEEAVIDTIESTSPNTVRRPHLTSPLMGIDGLKTTTAET
jgi:hypothetical protein